MTPTAQIKIMRANAVMSGIVTLSEQYPKHIPLEARPTPATDYLYDAIIIASLKGRECAVKGLCDFTASLVTDVLERRILPESVELPCKSLKDAQILRRIRSALKAGVTDPGALHALDEQWVSSHYGINGDHYLFYTLRVKVDDWAESFVRSGVELLLRTISALDTADYDWWHKLGVAINYFAHGYMAEAWGKTGPALSDPFLIKDGAEKSVAHAAWQVAHDEYTAMRWAYQEALFMRLANCIGDRAGRRPRMKDGVEYPDGLVVAKG